MKDSLLDRFIRYVKIDTESDPLSKNYPSTEKQKNLGRLLVVELHDLGITDAHMDEYGIVYATIPSNVDKKVPVICFCSHMDTSPDSSGKNVKPIIHENYQGDDIVLPDDNSQIISPGDHPHLLHQIGNDVITASGTTLLGADNKAGIAAIMDAAKVMMENIEIKHGDIRILFTCDEEIGQGVDKVDIEKLGADFGYTVDGEQLGSIENETFSADSVEIIFHGISAHPGFAKGKLVSSIKVASAFVDSLPKETLSPETTSDMEGFVHPVRIAGNVENTTVTFIVRDFINEGLTGKETLLENLATEACQKFPGAKFTFNVTEQYRNMKYVLESQPAVVDYAIEAMERIGIEPIKSSIRGGTDGSRLSYMGLPCPNIFAGEHAFHSKQEWVSLQDMMKSSATIVEIAKIWAEKS